MFPTRFQKHLNAKEKGKAFEDKACEYLESIGFRVVLRNYKPTKYSEADIIAIDGDMLVGVEVKGLVNRVDEQFGEDYIRSAVSSNKIRKVVNAVRIYQQDLGIIDSPSRIDVVFISGLKLFHYKNISA